MVALDSSINNPPLAREYNKILHQFSKRYPKPYNADLAQTHDGIECTELPLIDLSDLSSEHECIRAKCVEKITHASSEWGFFQVVNHGIGQQLLDRMREGQMRLFDKPFETKSKGGLLNNSYRWGTPTAKSPEYFSWSEAFHMSLEKISDPSCYEGFLDLRDVLVEYASTMQRLAKLLCGVLIENLGQNAEGFEEKISCDERTCFLRLNRYPKCSYSSSELLVYGLVPHTDSDFLTILHQDEVGGLQLMKDNKWINVKPHKDALIVNIGDLFQAWSNNLYKSVEHRVMANDKVERFSVAYFLCPSYDSLIESCRSSNSNSNKPSLYNKFTFREYREQIQRDAKLVGRKVGLSRFLR